MSITFNFDPVDDVGLVIPEDARISFTFDSGIPGPAGTFEPAPTIADALKYPQVNATGDGFQYVSGTSGTSTISDLTPIDPGLSVDAASAFVITGNAAGTFTRKVVLGATGRDLLGITNSTELREVAELSGLQSWVNGAITLNDDTGNPQTVTINLAGWTFPTNVTAQQFVGDGSQLTNVNPNSVTFAASTNVTPSTLVESADVTITGVSNGLWPIDVTGGNSSQLRINSGSWATSGLVQPADVVRLRTTSPAALGNTEVTLRMPRRRATWSVTSGSGGGGGPSLDFSISTNSMYIGAIL